MMKKMLMALLGSLFFCSGCCGKEAKKLSMPDNARLLDVRSTEEFSAGHIKGAVSIPHDQIKDRIGKVVPEKNTPLYIYCRSGRRVKIAIGTLKSLGYTQLHDLGGMDDALKILGK